MLISTRKRHVVRRSDWYSAKGRVHVDRRLPKADALRLVSNPATVAQHDFLPLISFTKRERRYRRESGKKKPVASTKERGLAYPSNRDGYIFAYYAERLGSLYEVELALRGLGDCVIGYRKGSSNIDRALEAFREIQARGDCAAVCLDIKGFFDNISHEVLKDCWSSLLGGGQLPDDHYKVFRALTKHATMDRADLLVRLGLSPKKRDADLQRPLCSIDEYRRLRSDVAAPSKLVSTYRENHGIPQGTPLSAAAAYISMLEFDTAVKAAVDACGGSYRRYSDDILILCAPEYIAALEGEVNRALKLHGKTLWLNEQKREEARFSKPGPALLPCPVTGRVKPLQYLGFTFDGRRALIRSGTLARYYRRMRNGVRVAKRRLKLAKHGEIKGRKVLHQREVLARHSHLGPRSFISGYARLARKKMGGVGETSIRGQLSRHSEVLKERLKKWCCEVQAFAPFPLNYMIFFNNAHRRVSSFDAGVPSCKWTARKLTLLRSAMGHIRPLTATSRSLLPDQAAPPRPDQLHRTVDLIVRRYEVSIDGRARTGGRLAPWTTTFTSIRATPRPRDSSSDPFHRPLNARRAAADRDAARRGGGGPPAR